MDLRGPRESLLQRWDASFVEQPLDCRDAFALLFKLVPLGNKDPVIDQLLDPVASCLTIAITSSVLRLSTSS